MTDHHNFPLPAQGELAHPPRPVPGTNGGSNGQASLEQVVADLCPENGLLGRQMRRGATARRHPSRDAVIHIVEDLRSVLFPGYFGVSDLTDEGIRFHIGSTLDRVRRELREQLKRGLCFDCHSGAETCSRCDGKADVTVREFISRLPRVRQLLATDVQAAYEGDPAAGSPDETIFCYPGVAAITNQRLAHELYLLDVPLIPRMITEHAHSVTGIDIHPGAQIGDHFFIDHGTGVVIGETSIIGSRVRLYQGVTLGAKSFPLDENGHPIKNIPRHPIVEDDVIIYAGATILGRVTVGRGSVIGGNVWLTRDVPAGSKIAQRQPRLLGFNGEDLESA